MIDEIMVLPPNVVDAAKRKRGAGEKRFTLMMWPGDAKVVGATQRDLDAHYATLEDAERVARKIVAASPSTSVDLRGLAGELYGSVRTDVDGRVWTDLQSSASEVLL